MIGISLHQRESGSLSLKTGAITRFGFQVSISTWSTTKVYAVQSKSQTIGA